MTTLVDRKHRLTSVEMAHFVSHGSIALSAVVPGQPQRAGHRGAGRGPPRPPVRHPPRHRLPGRHLRPRAARPAGGRRRHAEPGRSRPDRSTTTPCTSASRTSGEAQNMHGDAIIDTRTDAFDVQLMYYPQEVTLEHGRHAHRCPAATCAGSTSPTSAATRTCAARPGSPARPARSCCCTTASGTAAAATTPTSRATCSRSGSTRPSASSGCGTPTTSTTRPYARSCPPPSAGPTPTTDAWSWSTGPSSGAT